MAHPLSLATSTSTSPSPEGTAPHASHLAQPAPGAGLQRKNQSRGRAPQRYLVCVNTGHEKSHSFAKPVVFLDFQTHLQVAKFFFISLLCNSRSLDNPGFMHGSPWLTQCLSVYTVRRKALFSEAHLSNTDFVRAPNGGGQATEPRSGPRAMGISCSCTSNFAKKRTQLQLTLGYSTESLREKY